MKFTDCSSQINPYYCYHTDDNYFIGSKKTTADRRLYYIENRDKYLEYVSKYRKKNLTIVKERQRRWYQKNKEKVRIKKGYKKRYKTKDNNLINKPLIEKKQIILYFD